MGADERRVEVVVVERQRDAHVVGDCGALDDQGGVAVGEGEMSMGLETQRWATLFRPLSSDTRIVVETGARLVGSERYLRPVLRPWLLGLFRDGVPQRDEDEPSRPHPVG